MTASDDDLVAAAELAQKNAYAPYSRFRVGAALCVGERVFVGCNVENASYGATICAERGAIMAMVVAGQAAPDKIAIFTDGDEPAMPCGLCRQVLIEHNLKMVVLTATPSSRRSMKLSDLVPEPFVLKR